MSRSPTPPHSIEAEQAVLGSLLIDSKVWPQIANQLTPQDFYRADHRAIFAAITTLADAAKPYDVVMVNQHLERAGELDQAGGFAYLSLLARTTPTTAHAKQYAEAVRDRALLRKLSDLARSLERRVNEFGEQTASDLTAWLQQVLMELQTRSRTGSGVVSSRDLARELIDDLDRRREKPSGLMVGLSDFDEITSGLEPGDLVVIAARPGMGKTALLMSIADYVSQQIPTVVFSAEMPKQQLMRRAVAKRTNVPQSRLRRAETLSDADWSAISSTLGTIADQHLWIDDTPLPSLSHIRAELIALKARSGLGLVTIDYVQLVKGTGNNRYEELRDVAYGLKALAKDLAVPIVVLAQLNRNVEARDQKRPNLSDLRDSGAIEEAADIVGMLYRESYYDRNFSMPNVLECRIEKNRNGERGLCLWHFSGEHSRVTVLEPAARAPYEHDLARRRRGSRDDL